MKTFQGDTMQEALSKVKDEMGEKSPNARLVCAPAPELSQPATDAPRGCHSRRSSTRNPTL